MLSFPSTARGQFDSPQHIAFGRGGDTLLVAENINQRAQEVDLQGSHIRFIGAGMLDGGITGIAATSSLIAVSKAGYSDATWRVALLNYDTGVILRKIGGPLGRVCSSCHISPDDSRLYTLDATNRRVSVFSCDSGALLHHIGQGRLAGPQAVSTAANGDVVVADASAHSVLLFSADGTLRRTIGTHGSGPGEFDKPTAVAMHYDRLYVLEADKPRVQVFV